MSARVILVSSDLFFISKIKEVAASCGQEVRVARSHPVLERHVAEALGEAGLLLIDLEKVSVPLESLAQVSEELSSKGWRSVSFFSHVHVDTAENAAKAGLGEVMARSKFVRVLPDLLASL